MRKVRAVTMALDMDPAADSEPIRGVDLDRYARLSAEMLRSGLTEPDAIDRFAVEHGLEPGEWELIQADWVERLSRSEELRLRYRDAVEQDPPTADEPAGT